MKALVTGAAGFVGAVVSRKLLDEGHDAHLLVRPESNLWRLESLDAPCHAVEFENEDAVRRLLKDVRPEWIFHLAAHGSYSSQTNAQRMARVNILGTMNLVHAALEVGFEAMVNAGSSSEYGFTDHAPAEDERTEPNSHYALTKLSQTQFCRFIAKHHDVHIPTLRLYSVYGPFEEPSRFIPTLIAKGLEGRLPPLASPDIARDFVYSADVVDAFLTAATRNDVERGAIYNVGTGRQTTIGEAVSLARAAFAIEAEPVWASMKDRHWDTTTWVADPSKIKKELGWQARVPLEEGFARFTTWVREHPTHYTG